MMCLNTGAPHFKSIAKQHRHANYTLEKVINEGIDNIIKKATEIHIYTDVDNDNRLQELKISDNYTHGFESINEIGIQNPFNMGHIKSGHDDDDETSEFGVGLKAGALSAANQLTVISRVGHDFYEVICDFIKMEKEEDVNASYNPKIRNISDTEYKQFHPFPFGSSIIMSKIRETICERMSQEDLTFRIKEGISNTYSRFLNINRKIFVNGQLVEKEIDLFEDPKCKPFTIYKKLFVLEKGHDRLIIAKKTIERPTWQIFNKKTCKWDVIRNGEIVLDEKISEGYEYAYPKRPNNLDMSSIDIDTTFTFYSDMFHNGPSDDDPKKPFDKVAIYKDDRKYCNKSLEYHNNGSNNFTAHKIEFSSKKIGKELGITFNKEITMDTKNDLTIAIRLAIKDNRKEYSADIASSQNKKSCEKACREKIIDFRTCNIDKLSQVRRQSREELDKCIISPIKAQVILQSDQNKQQQNDDNTATTEQVDDDNSMPQEQNDNNTATTEQVDDKNLINQQPDNNSKNIEVVEDDNMMREQANSQKSIINIPNDVESEPRKLLIQASRLLMIKASSEICDIQLEDSIHILEFIKSIINI
jgi:hypothetical protein